MKCISLLPSLPPSLPPFSRLPSTASRPRRLRRHPQWSLSGLGSLVPRGQSAERCVHATADTSVTVVLVSTSFVVACWHAASDRSSAPRESVGRVSATGRHRCAAAPLQPGRRRPAEGMDRTATGADDCEACATPSSDSDSCSDRCGERMAVTHSLSAEPAFVQAAGQMRCHCCCCGPLLLLVHRADGAAKQSAATAAAR